MRIEVFGQQESRWFCAFFLFWFGGWGWLGLMMDFSIQWGSGGGVQVVQLGERRIQEQEVDGLFLSIERFGQIDFMSVSRGTELFLIQGWLVEVSIEEQGEVGVGCWGFVQLWGVCGIGFGRESWQRDGREFEVNECLFFILGIFLVISVGKDLFRFYSVQFLYFEFLVLNVQNLGVSVRICFFMDCGQFRFFSCFFCIV